MLYSEIFKSIQGEGHYTGVPTTWLRFFGCNLECNGFGQDDPTDPSTYKLPYKDFDIIEVKNVEDLPVWKYGCDSSYSWSKKFAKIQKNKTCEEVAKRLYDQMYNENTHIAFTGGEPLMKAAQKNTVKILEEMDRLFGRKRFTNITWETNGTRPLDPILHNYLQSIEHTTEFFFSVSPKLWSVAGEKEGIQPDIVRQYHDLSDIGQLKFVCNGTNGGVCRQDVEVQQPWNTNFQKILKSDAFDMVLPETWYSISESKAILGFRPHDARLVAEGGVSGRVTVVETLGAEKLVYLKVGKNSLSILVPATEKIRSGDQLRFDLNQDALHLFNREDEKRIPSSKQS